MQKNPVLSFKQIKQRVSIEQVLRHYQLFDGLRIRGKSHRGPCPFCEAGEGVPFSVSLEKNCYQCFTCHASGTILDFVSKWEGITLRQAGQMLNKNFVDGKESHHIPQGIQQEAQKEPDSPACLPAQAGADMPACPASAPPAGVGMPTTTEVPATEDALKELPSRNEPQTFALKNIESDHPNVKALGIPDDTLTAFGVGFYSGKGMMGNCIVIPVHNTSRELVAYAGYHPEERTYTYPPKFRRELELYNLSGALVSERTHDQGLILVRHPLEALMLISDGYHNTVALMGEAIAKEQVDVLFTTNGIGEKLILFWPVHESNAVHTLSQLLHLFFVQLIRYEWKETVPSGFTANEARALLA